MKKSLLAAIVGAIILFIWQFISWTAVNLHQSSQRYNPQQETIMTMLKGLQLPEGGYIMPMATPDASMDERNKMMDASVGKPWAKVEYHSAMSNNMALNMVRGLITNIITVLLLCWILSRMQLPSFKTIFLTSLFTGLIVFFNVPYTNYIWYESFDIWAHLADAVVSWGLCGLWLGWWFSRRTKAAANAAENRPAAEFTDVR